MDKSKKNEKFSESYKNQGNKCFVERRFFEAIKFYNKALCYAESNLQLSLLYGNRSAAYLERKKFKECLENIELAKKLGYPAEKMSKLLAREEKCKSVVDCMDVLELFELAVENFFKLSYKSHPKIPFIIDGIELKKSEEFGRHLITTRDLKPGDIIAIEEPFLKFLRHGSKMKTERCANCLRHNNLNLIPCDKCSQCKY